MLCKLQYNVKLARAAINYLLFIGIKFQRRERNTDCEMLQASLYYDICAMPLLTLTTLLLVHKTKAPYSAAWGKIATKLISWLPRGTSGSLHSCLQNRQFSSWSLRQGACSHQSYLTLLQHIHWPWHRSPQNGFRSLTIVHWEPAQDYEL